MENFINFLIFLYVLRLIYRSLKKKDHEEKKETRWKGKARSTDALDFSYQRKPDLKRYLKGFPPFDDKYLPSTSPRPLSYPPQEEDWLRGSLGFDSSPLEEILGPSETALSIEDEDGRISPVKELMQDTDKDAAYSLIKQKSENLLLFRQGIIMSEILQPPLCKRRREYIRR